MAVDLSKRVCVDSGWVTSPIFYAPGVRYTADGVRVVEDPFDGRWPRGAPDPAKAQKAK